MAHATRQDADTLARKIGGTVREHWAGGWQVLTPAGDSAVSTPYSYGGPSGLWEVYPAGADDVTGWLTVDDAAKVILS